MSSKKMFAKEKVDIFENAGQIGTSSVGCLLEARTAAKQSCRYGISTH